jgi:hypothetical protein
MPWADESTITMPAQLPSSVLHHDHPVRGRFQRTARAVAPAPKPPEDAARYVCGCGTAFMAAVTAGVTCPECGDAQAW